ncbi:MAG: tyrosine-type recombinase/integrase [Microgenomates group bacterium]
MSRYFNKNRLQMTSISAREISNLLSGERLIGDGLEVRKTKNDTVYYCSFMQNGVRVRDLLGKASLGYNLSRAKTAVLSARAKLAEAEGAIQPAKNVRMTFENAANSYLQTLEDINGNTIQQKRQQLRDHLVPFFRSTLLTSVTTLLVDKYKASRIAAGAAPGTVNSELAVLMHLYSSFIEWQRMSFCPFVCKKLKVSNQRIERFTDRQCIDLLAAAKQDVDPQIWLFVLIGLNTGMRHREILGLRFDQMESGAMRIFVPEAKAGSRSQPISTNVRDAVLEEQERAEDKLGWVFSGTGKTGRRVSMRNSFKRIVAEIGLSTEKFTPHVMRHTAITRLAERGTPAEKIRAISGHKSLAMVQRYTHLSDSVVDEALASAAIG